MKKRRRKPLISMSLFKLDLKPPYVAEVAMMLYLVGYVT